MKKSCTYRLNDLALAQLKFLQDYYELSATEIIEKSIDLLEQLHVNYQMSVDFLLRMPDTEERFFCKKL